MLTWTLGNNVQSQYDHHERERGPCWGRQGNLELAKELSVEPRQLRIDIDVSGISNSQLRGIISRDLFLGSSGPQLLKYWRCSRFSITPLTDTFEAEEEELDADLLEGELSIDLIDGLIAPFISGEDS